MPPQATPCKRSSLIAESPCADLAQGLFWCGAPPSQGSFRPADLPRGSTFAAGCKGPCKRSARSTKHAAKGRPANCEPSAAGRSWKGEARERADDAFLAAGIKRRRSKADFALTYKGRSKPIFLSETKNSRPQGGPPTASPAQRVAVGKEEQGSGRMTSFLPQA